jgi:hypothetical protein
MKYQLVSPRGVTVQLQTTTFETVCAKASSPETRFETLPVVHVGPSLMEAILHGRQMVNSISVACHPEGSLGVLHACGAHEMAVLLFDLGEPDVKDWLMRSRREGHLSMVFATEDAQRRLSLPADDRLEQMTRQMANAPAHTDMLQAFITQLAEQFDNDELLTQCRALMSGELHSGTVNVLVPTAVSLAGATTH